ncbi:MAG: SpoIIE family protein phosphatase [Treponema sp.]|nr:SpoIIE family protein phosphatase [Treponema sp.]
MRKLGFFFLFALICVLSLIFTGCKNQQEEEAPRIYLDDAFYYAIGQKDTTVEEAALFNYTKLPKLAYKNLSDITGKDGAYIWLKVGFNLAAEPALKGDDLSMLIPYLHFAEELYLNGYYIDDYGIMGEGPEDPAIQDAGLMAHLFDFPESFINQEEDNIVLIKVFSLGNGSITPGVFVGLRQDAWVTSDNMTFWRTRIYMFLEGFMLCVFIFFLMIFIAYRQDRIYFYLSFLSLLSMFFFSGFFGGDLPWVGFHGGMTYLFFFKFTKCACFFGMEYMFSLLVFDFLQMKHTIAERVLRSSYVAISVIVCMVAPNYSTLIKISHIIIWFALIDITLAIGMIIKSAIKGQKRERARMLLVALSPFLISINTDFVIKTFFNNITLPYYSIFGWALSVIICFLYFSTQYNRIAFRMEYLNQNLTKEVEEQTRKLVESNRKLAHEREIAIKDMHMAAVVQQKFFHAPKQKFKYWDYAVCYEPYSEVSGDFYNFHFDGDKLHGLSVFDASGHGVAAGLVTMLSETVIRQVYEESRRKHRKLSNAIEELNKNLIAAKGDVENYLTGVVMHIKESKGNKCEINISCSAHPYPLLYKNDDKQVIEIQPPIGLESYGPIGIDGIETRYTDFWFDMKKGDILILYTDGLTETMNEKREEFGKERVGLVLKENSRKGANAILQAVLDALEKHSGQELRTDDVTVIVLKRK